MNLYELAHHPDAFNCRWSYNNWGFRNVMTREQFSVYDLAANDNEHPMHHTNENAFRMHLLFVHWATTEDADMEGGCQ